MAAEPLPDNMPSPCFRAALEYLQHGFWPVALADPETEKDIEPKKRGKRPIEKQWGLRRPSVESLTDIYKAHPGAGVGLKLGVISDLIDIEIDDVRLGFDTLRFLFNGEIPNTLSWESNRGPHFLFKFDSRFAVYGLPKFTIGGVEFRVGGLSAEQDSQFQSAAPPTLLLDGKARRFSGTRTVARLPEIFFVNLEKLMKKDAEEKAEQEIAKQRAKDGPILIETPGAKAEKRDEKAFAAYINKALNDICDEAEKTQEGNRNIALHKAALCMGSLIGAHATDRRTCETLLRDVAKSLGLGTRESLKTIRSGIEAGVLKPRDMSDIGYVSRKQIRAQEAEKRRAFLEEQPYEWAPPRFKTEYPALPFPIDVFPEALRELCKSIAHKLKCPIDYPACAALGLSGAVSGLSVTLRVDNTWLEAPNLYLACVGAPGTSKSPACKIMEEPIFKIDARMRHAFEAEYEEWEEQEPRERGRPPVCRHLTLDDTTREAIASIHSNNLRGVAIVKDELASWINSMNAYRGGGDDVEFYLSANSGSLIKVTRKGVPIPLIIERPCISVFGPLTPSSLPALTLEGVDNGWFDRILFSYPERIRKVGWVYEQVPSELIRRWKDAIDSLWLCEMAEDEDGHPIPNEIKMTADALPSFIAWTETNETEMARDNFNSALEGPWSKMKGFCARFALILSRLRHAYNAMPGDPAEIGNVGIDDVWGAVQLAEYFKCHHQRARYELSKDADDENENAMMILKWIIKHHPEHCNRGQISRNYKYLNQDKQDEALTWLIARGYLRELDAKPIPGRRGRPPRATYEVNPFVRDPVLMEPPAKPLGLGETGEDENEDEL
jgi:hypothetical protein